MEGSFFPGHFLRNYLEVVRLLKYICWKQFNKLNTELLLYDCVGLVWSNLLEHIIRKQPNCNQIHILILLNSGWCVGISYITIFQQQSRQTKSTVCISQSVFRLYTRASQDNTRKTKGLTRIYYISVNTNSCLFLNSISDVSEEEKSNLCPITSSAGRFRARGELVLKCHKPNRKQLKKLSFILFWIT